ncbi:hypothetical protein C6558_35475 [Ensifer sp. NM-2]|nr:hypothetical protein C6558_35475 [Ensifer sp. NM-2]
MATTPLMTPESEDLVHAPLKFPVELKAEAPVLRAQFATVTQLNSLEYGGTGRIGRVLECQFVNPQRETGKTAASTISIASG